MPTPLGAIISIIPASTPIGAGLQEVVVLTVNAPSGSTPLMVLNPSAGCSNSAINGMDGVLTCAPPVLIIAGDADATGSITIGDAILSLSQSVPADRWGHLRGRAVRSGGWLLHGSARLQQ